MKNLAIVSVVTLVLAFALGVYATTLSYTWNPQAGDAILSADVRQDHAEAQAAVNNIDSTNISDSSITYAEMGANSVNATHLAPGAVRAVHIDSGAIMFDTQISFNAISADKIVSTTDTASNFAKMISGWYIGDGNDSRSIMVTALQSSADTGGVWIPFTITRVEMRTSDGTANGFPVIMIDGLPDTVALTVENAVGINPSIVSKWSAFGLNNGNPGSAFDNSGDSHWFTVNNTGGASATPCNNAGYVYYWTAWGY